MDKRFDILRENKNIQILWNILPKSRLVGGAVRDILFNRIPKDYDFAVGKLPEETIKLFEEKGFRVIETGMSHGTISVIINDELFEITTLKKDSSVNDDIWKQDALGRDFSFNALYIDRDLNLYDYFNGIEDIKNKTIHFVNDCEKVIKDDPVRMLRYFRFIIKYNLTAFENNKNELKVIKNNVAILGKISLERIFPEFKIIFNTEGNYAIFNIMKELGIFEVLFPWFVSYKETDFMNYYEFYAEMFKYSGTPSEEIMKYKMPNKDINKILKIINFNFDKNKKFSVMDLNKFTFNTDQDNLEIVRTSLKFHNIEYDESIFNNFEILYFPVTGKNLIEAGFNPGIKFKKIFNFLKKEWIEDDFATSKENLIKKAIDKFGKN